MWLVIGYFIGLLHFFMYSAFQQHLNKLGKQFHLSYVVGDWLLYWSYTFLYTQRIPTTLKQTRKTVSFVVCSWWLVSLLVLYISLYTTHSNNAKYNLGKQFHFSSVVGDWLLYWSCTFLYVQRIPTTLKQTRKTVSFVVCSWWLVTLLVLYISLYTAHSNNAWQTRKTVSLFVCGWWLITLLVLYISLFTRNSNNT